MTIGIHSCLSPTSRTGENKKRSTVSSICEQHLAETLHICPYEVESTHTTLSDGPCTVQWSCFRSLPIGTFLAVLMTVLYGR